MVLWVKILCQAQFAWSHMCCQGALLWAVGRVDSLGNESNRVGCLYCPAIWSYMHGGWAEKQWEWGKIANRASWDPSYYSKSNDWLKLEPGIVHVCGLSPQEAEVEGLLWVQGCPGVHNKLQTSLGFKSKPCLKNKWSRTEQQTREHSQQGEKLFICGKSPIVPGIDTGRSFPFGITYCVLIGFICLFLR